jgi:TetR/AcrR family transcriptional regulator
MDNQDKKREMIIEAALKRFAHFGLSKTTMNEIASDISLSKALLYYYFPDKIHLFTAVIDTLIKKIEIEVKEGLKTHNSCHSAILFYLDKRQEFVRKYFNLLEFVISHGPEIPNQLSEVFTHARNAEITNITSIIDKGNRSGEIHVPNPPLTAEILIDALAGMRVNHFAPYKSFYPDKSQFEQILKKEKQLAVIFLNGLKHEIILS